MKPLRFAILLLLVLLSGCSRSKVEIGEKVYLKSNATSTDFDLSTVPWPATVEDIDGNMLWLECAWVHRRDVMTGKQAEKEVRKRLKGNESDVEQWARLGVILYYLGSVEESDQAFDVAAAINPNDADAHSLLAVTRLQLGNVDNARKEAEEALELDDQSPEVLLRCGGVFLSSDNVDRAIELLTTVIEDYPDEANAYHLRGLAWELKKDKDQAVRDLNQAISLDPTNPLFVKSRARTMRERTAFAIAARDFNRPTVSGDMDADDYCNRGAAWSHVGELNKALEDYNRAIRLNPSMSLAYSNRGLIWFQKDEFTKSIRDCSKAILLDEGNAYAYYYRAQSLAAKSQYQRALKDYDCALELGCKKTEIYGLRATTRFELGDYTGAIEDGTAAIKVGPEHATAYFNRGLYYRRARQLESAVADFSRAIELDGKDAGAYRLRGDVLESLKRFDEALSDFEKARRLDPKNPKTLNAIAWMHATSTEPHIRNGKLAVEQATRACDITEWSEPFVIDTLAAAYAEAGDFPNAIKWAEKCLELVPKEKQVDFNERLELYRAGQPYREVE